MPAFVAPLVGFALGVVFAWAAREELAKGPTGVAFGRPLAVVVLFAFLVFGPMAGYFLTYATDWSFAYLVDGRRVPSALLLLLLLVDIAVVPVGFVAAADRAGKRRLVPILPLAMVPLAAAVLGVAAVFRKLALYGTYIQVNRGAGAGPLGGSPVGYAVLWFSLCLVIGIVLTVRELSMAPRRAAKSTADARTR